MSCQTLLASAPFNLVRIAAQVHSWAKTCSYCPFFHPFAELTSDSLVVVCTTSRPPAMKCFGTCWYFPSHPLLCNVIAGPYQVCHPWSTWVARHFRVACRLMKDSLFSCPTCIAPKSTYMDPQKPSLATELQERHQAVAVFPMSS